jgi:hypothetical protein
LAISPRSCTSSRTAELYTGGTSLGMTCSSMASILGLHGGYIYSNIAFAISFLTEDLMHALIHLLKIEYLSASGPRSKAFKYYIHYLLIGSWARSLHPFTFRVIGSMILEGFEEKRFPSITGSFSLVKRVRNGML